LIKGEDSSEKKEGGINSPPGFQSQVVGGGGKNGKKKNALDWEREEGKSAGEGTVPHNGKWAGGGRTKKKKSKGERPASGITAA